LFEQVECDAVEYGTVLCGVSGAFAVKILSESHVEHTVQFALDSSVLPHDRVQARCFGLAAGDVEAGLALDLARGFVVAFRFDTHQAL
jgi:hypothetical protein